jgi:hypothetical protein
MEADGAVGFISSRPLRGTFTDARCERRPGGRQARAGGAIPRPARAWQRRRARSTSNCHLQWRCVRSPTLDAGAGPRGRDIVDLRATRVVACWRSSAGHHLPCLTVPFSRTPGVDGGERWVAHTGVAGRRRVGPLRRSSGIGWPGHRRAVVVTPTRGKPGRGAGIPANRSATSRSERAPSCCRRIHSASTIAAASSSRLVTHAMLVAMSFTPFPECCAPGPAVRWTPD